MQYQTKTKMIISTLKILMCSPFSLPDSNLTTTCVNTSLSFYLMREKCK